jgi:SulP family sulfate permease
MRAMARPSWRLLRSDAIAGLPGAIGSVPDGMAASVLAGISPIHGLYASFIGPIAGGATASTRRMVIATTSAAALAGGSAVARLPEADREPALFLLTLLAGGIMLAAGILRLGRYTRFVSHSVMLGFLSGIACNIIFGQLPDLTGVTAQGRTAVQRGLYVLLHPGQIDVPTLVTGLLAIAIIAGLQRTKLRAVSALLALIIPTVIAAAAGWSVELVADAGSIPTGVPLPALPKLSYFSVDLLVGAAAVAIIVLIQGAGVAETAPNLDGSLPDPDRDFLAQGAGNIASSLFQGQPVGGSVGQTALNITAGARDRWAGIFSGVWMLLILVVFSGVVGKVAMATLAGLLIVAAFGALHPQEVRSILRSGPTSQIALITTFLATLALPIAAAVGIGVALSLLLQVNQEAMDLRVVELRPDTTGLLVEGPVPDTAPSRAVTMVDVYGSLLYAGSKTLQRRLPDPAGTDHAAIVLRLRGRTSLGSTFFSVLGEYAGRLGAGGGRLFLSGVAPELYERMASAGVLARIPNLEVWQATKVVSESSLEAYHAARDWLARSDPAPEEPEA